MEHGDGTTRRRRQRALAIVSVVGELFLTAGVICFLFIGWQLWLNDLVVGQEQRSSALELEDQWRTPGAPPVPPTPGAEAVDYGEPVVAAAPREGTGFATLYVPRFGAGYVRPIGEGVSLASVLNNPELGIGHYPETQLPGELGNFALAAHRTTWGAPFKQIADLRVGDKLYVQTSDGWYTYAFRSLEYVWPTGVGVLEPVPQAPGVEPFDRVITLTSCNPMFSAAERIIAYGVLEHWQPTSAGMPVELSNLIEEA
ncbi:MAG TPA: class E sortase [Homoserinimonas sp.]|nr:class E sortase [Homoserinimonas sp.]